MKIPLLFFVAGCAAGALVMWFIKPASEPGSGGTPRDKTLSTVMAAKVNDELARQTARVQALEKEVKDLKSSMEGTPVALTSSLPVPALSPLERMEDLERKQDEKDVNREVDRLSLRLKLTGDQKAALRKFLADGKERQRAAIRTVTNGGFPESPSHPEPTEEEFLAKLLTAEQQTEYARGKEEQRRTRAEEYAQRKVRKLNNELNLSEQQKDKLFQAYAQRKLEATDPAQKATEGGTAPLLPGVVDYIYVVEIDRKTMEAILTPEQLAVYDQRVKDENEPAGPIITREENGLWIEELPVPLPTGDEEEDEEMEDEDASGPQ